VLFVDHLVRLVRELRWRAVAVAGLLAVTGVFEGIGLLLLVPLLGVVGLEIQSGPMGRLAAVVTRALAGVGLSPTLGAVLGVFLAVNVVLSLLRRLQLTVSAALEQEVVRRTVERVYDAVVRMDWLTFTRMRAADLTVALTSEGERVGLAASLLLSLFVSSTVTAVYVALAMWLSVKMTLLVSACGALLALLARRRTRRASVLGGAFSDSMREYQAAITDDLVGMKTIRSMGAEQRSFQRVSRFAGDLADLRQANIRHYANSTFWLEVGSVAVLSALVFVAVDRLRFQSSAILMLLLLFARIVPRVTTFQQKLEYYVGALPSVERIDALEKRCRASAEFKPVAVTAMRLQHAVQLVDVSFHYDADAPRILDAFDMTIDAGTTVGLVGSSGAGKTTVADLLMGLLTPAAGRVVIDGEALSAARMANWRQAVAYVPQDTFLFHDTLSANMRWAVPDASDDAIGEALRMAAAEFVFDLPAGLATVVGDRGVRLSGGERQRIALARALLRHPSVLILDEATSALDSENESRIFDAIRRLHGSLTIVIITHRLASLADADRIHVIEGGRVVESGSWTELTARSVFSTT
jgi:ATP-binding cassette subfamily C protein